MQTLTTDSAFAIHNLSHNRRSRLGAVLFEYVKPDRPDLDLILDEIDADCQLGIPLSARLKVWLRSASRSDVANLLVELARSI